MSRNSAVKRRSKHRSLENGAEGGGAPPTLLPNLATVSPRTLQTVDWSVLAIMLALFVIVLTERMHDGVVPHDTGTLAHAAERVVKGQLPHRDFDDPYTGGLSVLNAAAFHLFGVSILSARWMLIGFTTVAFGILYRIFRRLMPIWAAVLLTVAAFGWSVPNYFEPMPSWYNLYFGIFTIAALLKYGETERRGWLVVAGFCTGLSFLIKVIGLYFAAVGAMYVIFLEQRRAEQADLRTPSNPLATGFVIGGLAMFVVSIGLIIRATANWSGWITFFAPAAVMAGYLAVNERRLRFHDAAGRARRLLSYGGLYFIGVGIPVALFLIPYALMGGLYDWFDGVFISPLRRLDVEMARTLDVKTFTVGCVIVAVGIAGAMVATLGRTAAQWASAAIVVAFIGLMIAIRGGVTYAAFWDAARLLPLAASVALTTYLMRRSLAVKRRDEDPKRSAEEATAFLFLSAAGVFALVQYPIVNGIYFLYVAPLIVAAIWFTLGVLVRDTVLPRVVWCVIVLGFTSYWVWPGSSFLYGTAYFDAQFDAELDSRRMPLRYDPMSVKVLEAVKEVVQQHSAPGSPIFSFPDTPHIYFLTKRENPTRTFFDVFDPDYGTPARDKRLLKLLDEKKVQLVVERNFTSFSTEEPTDEFRTEIRRRFPHRYVVQDSQMRYFTIRWRDGVTGAPPATAMSTSRATGL